MAPVEITDDYYAVLEVPYTATHETVRKSYRRLALNLHPDRNPNNPSATAAFQLVILTPSKLIVKKAINLYRKLSSAYETINDPSKRRTYDTIWARIKEKRRAEEEAQKRETEAAEKERKRAAEEKVEIRKEESKRQERLQHLQLLKSRHENDIFEGNRVVRRLAADLKRLQDQDDDELRKERERNTWWTYMTSPIYGEVKETEEQKQRRETERLQRLASKSIKENQLAQKEAILQKSRYALDDVNSEIAAVKKEEEDDARVQAVRRQEQLRKEEEASRRVEEEQRRKKRAKWEEEQIKLRREQAARAAKVTREAQEAQERVREEAAKKYRAESEKRTRAASTPERARTAGQAQNDSACLHDKFWPRLEGRHLCRSCCNTQRHFAFQCPGCRMIACAGCRQTLRGERRRNNWNSGRRFHFDSHDDTDFEYYGYGSD